MKDKEELKNKYFPVVVTNMKRGTIISTCGKDNIIGKNVDFKAIRLKYPPILF